MSSSASAPNYHLELLKSFINLLVKQPPFNSTAMDEQDQDFLEQLVMLTKAISEQQAETHYQGQELIGRLIRGYPQLLPLLDRELLWFFGGDCLHYMPDEEISMYQQLDDMEYETRSAGANFDRREQRARMLKLQ